MSSVDRQNRLLVTEDWKRIYQTFRNADFTSYDFENLRRTMIDYIRQNYPEDFNDWIASSEFIVLIDLMAFLGQNIAFRVDLNARENFLELAERRESVLRLARMLSYNPKRNIPAKGLLKFTSISTTESLIDNNSRNLSGQIIAWNDSSNPNWYEQFIKIINAAMSPNQQFGHPSDKKIIYGVPTEQYRFETTNTDAPIYGFNKAIASRMMNFEITSTTFKNQDYIYEETPHAGNKLACIFKDDARGAASPGSGFFLNIVQGNLNTSTFTITQPSTNESVDIASENINNDDVWLYRLDTNNIEFEEWTKVPDLEGNNIIYNSLNKNIRNIFGVITRANDSASLTFSDGTFGNLPLGTFKVYYRVSNGLSYVINPQDIRNVSINVTYVSRQGKNETLNISMSLMTSISNSSTAETNESIKSNAPATYYTQNRMITGEDYNISPLNVNQQILKIKAINRSSSGISRYFDLVDPTGKYSSTNLFATDGVLYQEEYINSVRFSYTNRTDIEGILYNQISELLNKQELKNFYYNKNVVDINADRRIIWRNVTGDFNSSTGYFQDSVSQSLYKLASYTVTELKHFKPGALLRFDAPVIDGVQYYFDTNNSNKLIPEDYQRKLGTTTFLWTEIVSVINDGTATGVGVLASGSGPVTLNKNIPENVAITKIIPVWKTSLNSTTVMACIDLIFANKPFGLRYAIDTTSWEIIFETNLNVISTFNLNNQGDSSNSQLDASWSLLFTTDNEFYTVQDRELRYIFESDREIKFYFDSFDKIYDGKNNLIIKDSIVILNINTIPGSSSLPMTKNVAWNVISEYVGLDGYVDPKKLVVSFSDNDDNGQVDNPESFSEVVLSSISSYIAQERYLLSEGQEDYRYSDAIRTQKLKIVATESSIDISIEIPDQYFYIVDTNVVKKLSSSILVPSLDYRVYIGRDQLKFQYKHNADHESRIDPGSSNIIDIFVLTKAYDLSFRQWINSVNTERPLPPSSTELQITLSPSLNLIKSVSDEIIYHPGNYKILFGANADLNLQAIFKVTKNSGRVVSDNDIKSRVISAINEFFQLENWDFGDTFYFTELATFVINKLVPDVTNFIIVPKQDNLNFGNLFEIHASSDQLFVNCATVDDIEIISGITSENIKTLTNVGSSSASNQFVASSQFGSL